jgi:GNAT superfamily N-acetyltransferase
LRVRPASLDDVDEVLDVLAEASEWVRARGYDNWPARFPRSLIAGNVDAGDLYIVERAGAVIATLTLQWSDEFFWGVTDADAGYVHRLAVRRSHAGAGVGYELLAWADEQVRANGRAVLRLDVVSDNRPLRDYYEAAGFAHRRDVTGEFELRDGTRRGWQTSLYERACGLQKT